MVSEPAEAGPSGNCNRHDRRRRMKTPSWDDIREFLELDRWTLDRATGHDHYEKVLPDGEILRTDASRTGDKSISPGRFKAILSDQLRVSEAEFWQVLRTDQPAARPSRA